MADEDPLKALGDGIKRNILNQLTGRTYLRDYTHAAKVFIPGDMANAGKVKFTFHTFFQINPTAYQPPTGQNYGVLVKSIKLPTFNMEVQELNQYNRKRLIQSKIKYQPIEVTFHDDNASQITAMWDAYYRYNYADAWNPIVAPFANAPGDKDYNRRNIYDPSITGDTEYGYRGDARGDGGNRADDGEKVPFFNNITVYGFWAGNYIAYTLINPIITTFGHDTYDYSDGGGTMQNRMTINYETVVYNTGKVGDEVAGFGGVESYHTTESPLKQGGSSPFGPYPIGGGFDEFSDFTRTGYEIYKDGGTSLIASTEAYVKAGLTQAVLGALGLGSDADIPTNQSTPDMVNIANQGIVTAANNNQTTLSAEELQSISEGTSAADIALENALGFPGNAGKQTTGFA